MREIPRVQGSSGEYFTPLVDACQYMTFSPTVRQLYGKILSIQTTTADRPNAHVADDC
jgi:hypothetical protein